LATTSNYGRISVDLGSREAREHLVDVSGLGIAFESYYFRTDGFNSPYYQAFSSALPRVYCRETVAKKLLEVNTRLYRFGAELFLWDAFRPITCQRQLWDFFVMQARLTQPKQTEEKLIQHVSQYCSDPRRFDPKDFTTWPTHITGGAVDLTLRRLGSGELLYMGGTFDDPSPLSHTAYFEKASFPALTASGIEALRNRRLLFWAMSASGFANYPFEWWHFDWGTQMWILNQHSQHSEVSAMAVYGPAELL